MPDKRDVVIIGGGHNGLVAAFYLAKAGFKPLVLERRSQPGGAAITEEFHPGFRGSILAHSAGPLRADVVRDMQLEKNGLRLIKPEVGITALSPDGRALVLYSDVKRAAEEVSKFSAKDAAKYPEFKQSLDRISRVIEEVLSTTPPDIDNPSSGDLWRMLKTGRAIRNLGKKDMYRLLRWGPMAAADLVAEYFETELLRAVVAARGIFGTFLGPWSAGSSLVLLLRAAADSHPAGSAWFAAGGMGAVTQAMAAVAKQAGAEIRSGVEVIEVRVKDGTANSVVLSTGEEISATAIVSNADPKRTFLKMVDARHLPEAFLFSIRGIKMQGPCAKVNFVLSEEPNFTGTPATHTALERTFYTLVPSLAFAERCYDIAKFGDIPEELWVDCVISSNADPSLAPAGKHILTCFVQYVPYYLRQGNWDDNRELLGDRVVKKIAEYAPNVPASIIARQVLTPLDLERTYGLTEGNIFHGDLRLEQLFFMRPVSGWSQYRTPVDGLYLCGAGAHPGGGVTGAPGHNAAHQVLRDWKKGRLKEAAA